MCRIDERVYVRTDGHKSVFQDTTLCERGRQRKQACSDARVRRTEYPDPTSSPMASSPLTPTYNTRARRPSVSSRPSTRDGPITSLRPEIHIEIGSKKGKGKSYVPTVSITTGKAKRASTGSTSGSEASHTVRTGYPDISPPPLGSSHGGLRPRNSKQRNPPSDESFSGSSRVPSLYQTSDGYDSPSLATTTTGASSGHAPIIHNGARHLPSSANTTYGYSGSPASPYLTTEFKPSSTFNETADHDYRNSSTYASEIVGRDEDRQRRREEQRRRQEALDRDYAASAVREENQKHVRFEKTRKEQPTQKSFTAHERRRAEEHEELRQRKQQQQEEQAAREAAAKEAAANRSKPTTTHTKSRGASAQMTAAQAAEQQHLVAAEAYQMAQERMKTEAMEREEQRLQQSLSLQQRQQDPGYYDPRGERTTVQQPPISRRRSQSNQPRPDLGRRTNTRGPPPPAYYNAAPDTNLPPARERRSSLSHGAGHNPFASPPAAAAPVGDPWDTRAMGQALPGHAQGYAQGQGQGQGQALPTARGPQVGHNFPPQQATRRMTQALYDDEETYRRR
ncbi:hypothetical protein SVAN01_10995 [Stagonosporopsis vannaccii]|nr:hypothetical protein SVAN01_10995 [Stagonosporopsis vannaccii]